jgi:hypothetical protein
MNNGIGEIMKAININNGENIGSYLSCLRIMKAKWRNNNRSDNVYVCISYQSAEAVSKAGENGENNQRWLTSKMAQWHQWRNGGSSSAWRNENGVMVMAISKENGMASWLFSVMYENRAEENGLKMSAISENQ